jgi:CheY-like chemotaxis protein
MNKPRIYVVENEPPIADAICDRLTKLGYDVCGRAASGETALAEIPAARPDGVLMDINLDGKLTGIETASRLRALADVPTVFLTALADPAQVEKALGSEPFGYLIKPFDKRALDATLKTALYKHRMERQRARLDRLETQLRMAGGMTHDFNNILQVIVGHLSLAKLAAPQSGAEVRLNIDEALQATHEAAAITRKLHQYTGGAPVSLKATDISALVRAHSASLRRLAGSADGLHLNLGDTVASVMINEALLEQALDQLVANSAEACGGKSKGIRLSTGTAEYDRAALSQSRLEEKPRPGAFVYLEVADDGCGMDDATLHRAFDPFFTTKMLGRGLGLASVYGIMRKHRGGILASSSPAQGTSIRLLFPIQEQPLAVAAPAAGEPARGAGSTQTILVVDDDAAVRKLCRRILEQFGHQVLTAEGGAQALAIFQKQAGEITGVLLDLEMPGMDGIATLAELRRIRPNVRVLLASGYYREDLQRIHGDKGFAGFLQKPFCPQTLRDALERRRGARLKIGKN